MTRGAAWLLLVLCACGPGRDVESAPVHASAPQPAPSVSAPNPAVDTPQALDTHAAYERTWRRPHALFGLAETRELDPVRLEELLELLSDRFEACAQRAALEGWLEAGAVRLVVDIDPHGQVRGHHAALDDPSRGGKTTLLCLVANVRAQNYGERQTTSRRGYALEVMFGPPDSL